MLCICAVYTDSLLQMSKFQYFIRCFLSPSLPLHVRFVVCRMHAVSEAIYLTVSNYIYGDSVRSECYQRFTHLNSANIRVIFIGTVLEMLSDVSFGAPITPSGRRVG